jgi:nuclear GTP-binding protein
MKTKGTNFYKTEQKVKKEKLLKSGRPVRDKKGKIIKAAEYQTRLPSGTQHRIDPNRRWFENTRVVGQKELEVFRESMQKTDPYQFVMRTKQLPIGLLHQSTHTVKRELQFQDTFGPKKTRKRPKLHVEGYDELHKKSEEMLDGYDSEQDGNKKKETGPILLRNPIFEKGQSKRIWNELYKVIDSSDVVLHVLDARDPEGTRCRHVENYLKKEKRHKQLVFVLNKVDLVPAWVTVCILYFEW